MKKIFAILAVAGVLVACNDSGHTEPKTGGDSATQQAAPTPAVDSTKQAVDTTKQAVDTTGAKKDTTAKH